MKQAIKLHAADHDVDEAVKVCLEAESTAYLKHEADRIYRDWHKLHRSTPQRKRFVFYRTQILNELYNRGESI